MSLETIRSSLQMALACNAWEMELIRITSRNRQPVYSCCDIKMTPTDSLCGYAHELIRSYLDGNRAVLNTYQRVVEYDGTAEGTLIYKLDAASDLVTTEYDRLKTALANPETEVDALSFDANAYSIGCSIDIDEVTTSIKLISMKKPVISLKHKFAKDGTTFKEISDKVLALRSTIDVLTIGNTIYFMNMSGENLFHMERAYRAICQNKMGEIRDAAIIADPTCFMSVACSGHNPRRFVSFNRQNLEYLQNAEARQRLATKFSIALTEDGMLNISDEKSAEKLVKLLCNKGMLNPFDDSPVEVSGARNWT